MSVRVVTDSLSSIPPGTLSALDIDVVTLFVHDGESNLADLEIDHEAFFRRLADMSHLPTSSQPSVDSLVQAFTRTVEHGGEAVGVFVSEKMSGTVQTARLAADMVRERFADARIEIVDSRSNSMEEGFAAIAAAKAAQAGRSIDECVNAALESMKRSRYLFAPESLEYLRRGGRIGAASALFGQILQINPVLTVADGVTAPVAKVRTHRKAIAELARRFAEDVERFGLRDLVVHYIGDPAPAQRFATELIEPIAQRSVEVVPVSPVIGLHVGPAVAIAYETEEELTL